MTFTIQIASKLAIQGDIFQICMVKIDLFASVSKKPSAYNDDSVIISGEIP